MKDKILVTGSAGLLGSHTANFLTKLGHNVIGVDNLSGGHIRNTKNHKFYFLDLQNKKKVDNFIKEFRPIYVYNFCASAREIGSIFSPLQSTNSNILTFMTLINSCIKFGGLKKFIHYSTMAVYGNQKPPFSEEMECKPEDIYAINKTAIEQSLKCLSEIHDFNYTVIRPHNCFGINQIFDLYRNVIAIWMNRIMHGEKQIYIFGDGKQKRAFSYITFSLNPYIKCLEDFTNRQIYNIGGINHITLNEVAILVLKAMGVEGKVAIEYLPPRPKEVKYAYSTYDKSVKELGYKEDRELLDCLIEMANWCKSLGPQPWLDDPLELENDKTPEIWRKKKVAK